MINDLRSEVPAGPDTADLEEARRELRDRTVAKAALALPVATIVAPQQALGAHTSAAIGAQNPGLDALARARHAAEAVLAPEG